MSVEYDFRKRPSAKEEGKRQPLYPQVVSKGTIKTEELVREISTDSSFSPGDVVGVLTALERRLVTHLQNGYHVQLGEIGYFSCGLKARPVMDKREIRAASIYVDHVNFRASSSFKRRCKGMVKRVSSGEGFQESAHLPLEERKACVLTYLQTHPFITRTVYSTLTGLLQKRALADLKLFIQEGLIVSQGRGSHKVYVLPENRATDVEEGQTFTLHLTAGEPL